MLPDNHLQEYADPENYDIEQQSCLGLEDPGTRFYAGLAQAGGGPVLEPACGTGRALLPIARLGIPVVGLDLAHGMLRRAHSLTGDLPAGWLQGDMRRFRLAQHFRLVFLTGNAFQALLTHSDQRQFLTCTRRHLHPEGRLAFETRNPRPADLVTTTEEEVWDTYRSVEGHTVTYSGVQRYDPQAQIMEWTSFRRWQQDGAPREKVTRVAVRFTAPQALEALLAECGFEIVEQYGDFQRSPLTAGSPSIVSVCRPLP